ncbi:hypothetical protein A2U01_0084205, partial [Trifolium medium]|nr:hypothetical protein [Trifolium medium]
PKGKKELEMKQEVLLSDSDETNEDWREFLWTYKPHESYSDASSPDEDDGTITVKSEGGFSNPHQRLV